jgi:hypothetical protein
MLQHSTQDSRQATPKEGSGQGLLRFVTNAKHPQ